MERIVEMRQYARIKQAMDNLQDEQQPRPSGPLADLWEEIMAELLAEQFGEQRGD